MYRHAIISSLLFATLPIFAATAQEVPDEDIVCTIVTREACGTGSNELVATHFYNVDILAWRGAFEDLGLDVVTWDVISFDCGFTDEHLDAWFEYYDITTWDGYDSGIRDFFPPAEYECCGIVEFYICGPRNLLVQLGLIAADTNP